MELIFQVKNQRLYLNTVNQVVADSKGYLTASFTFTDDWDGTVKIAQFTRGTATTNVTINATTGKCAVPQSVLLGEGEFFVSVYGTRDNETVIITANAIRIAVMPSGFVANPGPISQADAAALAAHADAVEAVINNTTTGSGGYTHKIEFIIKNQTMYLATRGKVVADSQGYLGAKFHFSEDWDGLVKIAQFKRGDLFYSIVLNSNDECVVPWEVLVDEGIFIANVFGNNQQNEPNKIVTVNPVEVYVEKSGLTAGELPDQPTEGIDGQTLYEIRQYTIRAEAAADTATTAAANALRDAQSAGQSVSDASGYASAAASSASAAALSAENAAADAAALDTAVTEVEALIDGLAPLNSPAFTGTPTAPTPADGNNSTRIATTAFVRNEIADLLGSAPATLDTLNELAAALGDDPNFATTMTTELAKKLNLTGGTMTGELKTTSQNSFRMIKDNYGAFFRNDGNKLYLLQTESGEAENGSWTSARPLTLDFATGVCSINGSAAKLATARNISVGDTDFTGSANFNGTGNISLNATMYNAKVSNGNMNNYPYHYVGTTGLVTSGYVSKAITLLITRDTINGGCGIARIEFRCNNVSAGNKAQCRVSWLIRDDKIPVDCIQVGFRETSGDSIADIFFKTPGTWYSTVLRAIQNGSGTAINRAFTLFDSSEVSDTTTIDKKTSVRSYATTDEAIADLHADKTYTSVITATDNPIFLSTTGGTLTGQLLVNKDNTSSANNAGIKMVGAGQNFALSVSNTNVTKGSAPSGTQYWGIDFYGKDTDNYNKRVGMIETQLNTSNVASTGLVAYNCTTNTNTNTCKITVNVDGDGNAYTSAPTPAKTSNNTNIATTAFVKTNLADYLPLSGGTLSGNISFSQSAVNIALTDTNYTGGITIFGGADGDTGAGLRAYGKSHSTEAGAFWLHASDGANSKQLRGYPNGILTWGGKNIERVNASGTNYIRYESGLQICWGRVTDVSTTDKTVTLPAAFNNGSYAITMGGGGGNTPMFRAITSTSFDLRMSSGTDNIRYVAIGYWK